MNTRVLAMSVVLATATVAMAQTRPAPPAPPGDRPGVQLLERIRYSLADLNLSSDQKAKVDDIFKKARESMDGMREKMRDLEPRQRMEEGEKFFKSVRDELAGVLDKSQIETLDKKLEAARENLRNRFGPGRERPTTAPRPGAGPRPEAGPGGPMRPGEMMERLRTAIPKLQLNDSQRQEIRALMEDVQSRGQMLRQQAEAGGEDVRVKAREMIEETRTKLNKILTPEQQEKLRSIMGDAAKPAAGATPSTKAAMMMEGDDMMSAGEKKSSRKTGGPFIGVGDLSKAQVGSPAPSFALKKTDGGLVQLSSLKGRVIVLEFGSYTCPAFRDRVPAMEKLKTDYSTRAQFFVVYTKEAHAKGEWEVSRNKDNEISLDQPTTMDVRMMVAKKSRDELKLTTPILVDNMENETATAYGAGPNSAVVINRDGIIVHKQQWFDPAGLRRAIDEAAKATPSATSQPGL